MRSSRISPSEAKLERRDQRMAAGNELCSLGVLLQEVDGLCERTGPNVVEGGGNHWLAPLRARCTAAQMRGGVSGMSRWVMPNGESASSRSRHLAPPHMDLQAAGHF